MRAQNAEKEAIAGSTAKRRGSREVGGRKSCLAAMPWVGRSEAAERKEDTKKAKTDAVQIWELPVEEPTMTKRRVRSLRRGEPGSARRDLCEMEERDQRRFRQAHRSTHQAPPNQLSIRSRTPEQSKLKTKPDAGTMT